MLATSVVALQFHFSRLRQVYISVTLAAILSLAFLWFSLIAPPGRFPAGTIITVEEGSTVREVADRLYEEGIVRSPVAYTALMRISGALPDAGKYVFHRPVGLFQVAYRTAIGGFGIEPTRIVFHEGTTVREMARVFAAAFPDFDADAFVEQGLPLEGYLFPNTYFFYPDVTPEDALITLFSHFNNERDAIAAEVVASKHSEKDLIIMASILQKEGRGLEEMRSIAGVLWHRIEIGMPLQVDAVFSYIKDVPLYSPKFSELEIESPYNTYLNKGLPPGPIGNPGSVAILAAATPATTTSLFYLTGNDGVTRFAKTFEEHKRNRALYLD
ncbi:MAG: endolytic transglycosylase MltG [Candidatus Pacebacteria bacterium]|nr:endolytic transglycosylase MltG [Candidatus Paceibacterota bacterium]MBP9840494.1 endolytic transglycosylase MltG [Candidatus Paceibacterota bacterium]